MLQPPLEVFDPWSVDSVTIAIAIVAAALVAFVRYMRGIRPAVTRRRVINDFLNASVIYPFMLLVFSVASTHVFNYLKDSRIALGLAGGVGIIFVVGELIVAASPEKPQPAPEESSLG
jgi:uncharacterized membrane protein (DUF373 family)